MNNLVTGNNKVAKEICDALGLKHVKQLDFHMAVDEIATVTVKYYPEIDGVQQFPAILKKYELIEIQEDSNEAAVLGGKFNTFVFKGEVKKSA